MSHTITMRLIQIWESLTTEGGLISFLHRGIYFKRKAIIIEKDLLEATDSRKFLQDPCIKFEEVTLDTINRKNYHFPVKNRFLKALHYLKKGYGGHIIVKGNKVIGDVWHSATTEGGKLSVHPDVYQFGMNTSGDFAYTFDQYVVPDERGNKVAAALLNSQICALREKGYLKVVGYYWADNLPAIWNTRVINKFKELKTLSVIGLWSWKRIS